MERFPMFNIAPTALKQMIHDAYSTFNDPSDVLPVTHLENNQYLMEEFQGPTASFKDLALQLTPKLFTACIESTNSKNYAMLVATSGDTGSSGMS
jgi:threonine synthase